MFIHPHDLFEEIGDRLWVFGKEPFVLQDRKAVFKGIERQLFSNLHQASKME